ncbi:MAG: DEAD/DEAH box helicase family protein [Clostridia bacterium]|nr:DEAD/DEAH box helicase family protein [Clostridia bacterium]
MGNAETMTVHAALDRCVDLVGRVDLDIIAHFAKIDSEQARVLLRSAVYFDPQLERIVTAEEYLSGNIQKKLDAARAALEAGGDEELLGNIAALEAVLPERIMPNQIKASIGSPWIPTWVYRDFIIALIGIKSNSGRIPLNVEYIREANHYIIHGKKQFREFTRAKFKYGTERMDAFEIIERMLNSRDIAVYDNDIPVGRDSQVRRVNKEETLLAQERAREISERFSYWLFKDEPRRTKLLDLYNEAFCAIRPRRFDGARMLLPGKNPEIKLQKHQLDAVNRIVHSKNVLIAHQVGAGKTYVLAAAAMELRRLGISKRNLIVVPNNILEQWHYEFLQLYPDANVLMVEPRSFVPAGRNRILNHIKNTDYDAILMGYGSFSLIPLSKDERERELIGALSDISESMKNAVYNDAYTVLNRYASRIERRLQKLWEEEAQIPADAVFFDDLGIDTIFVDEAHNFKNISIETKHGSLPGLNTKGSRRCDDLMAKIRFIQRTHGGRGAVFATGTPITNSVSDMYTLQRYLGYEHMDELNLLEFDNWVKMFSEVTEEFEVEANGVGYRLRRRLSKYYNLPELSLLFSDIADLYFNSEDEAKKLPQSVDCINCIVPASESLRKYIEELANRAEIVKQGAVPRTEDNMLKITTDGRKAALDMRLVDPDAEDDPDSKLNSCVKNVFKIWSEHEKLTQLVFLDQSTPKDRFNIYDDIKKKLIALGMPQEEIAFVHDALNDAMRTALFNKVRKGRVRVLIGSTFKLGLGANVQKHLLAVHHLDIPWRPSDVTQREGRMLRRGNRNEKVMIYRYITSGSFDAYSWQLLENKQRFISQIVNGDYVNRSGDEVDEIVLTYSEVKAFAVGDPLIKRKIELETELQRKQMLKTKQERAKLEAKQLLMQIPGRREELKRIISILELDAARAEKYASPNFTMMLWNEEFTKRREAGERLIELIAEHAFIRTEKLVGSYRGFEVYLANDASGAKRVILLKGRGSYQSELSDSAVGIVTRMDNVLSGLGARLENTRTELERLGSEEKELADAAARESELDEVIAGLRRELHKVNRQLGMI